jgi:ferritin
MLIRQYLLNNGEAVVFTPIDAPDEKYSDFKEPLTKALEHERYVTDLINKIYEAAEGIKDYRTIKFLDWFIQEQGEEEKNAEDNIRKYELFANDSKGLYLLDNEMKARVYVAPSLVMD